ncbi:MAG: DUF421 domain-containing protein [Eubacterium sp.]|nr:DUF421 domain-containing protein [Eubacterium sp.]
MEFLYAALLVFVIILQIVILLNGRGRKSEVFLMHEGRFLTENMKKHRVSYSDLAAAARGEGYFNIADIDTAVLERDGSISLLPQAKKRRLNPKDFNFAPVREGAGYIVYQNKTLSDEGLRAVGLSEGKLRDFLASRGYTLDETELIVVSESGRVTVF